MKGTFSAKGVVEQVAGLVLDMTNNKLPAGSVIMCKFTAFVIKGDGDIDYMGGGKMEMVYHANDQYFKFLNQQVKELHMERSQGFIKSVFRALTGSWCKTRRRQVTGMPPTPVTIGSHTLATSATTPTRENLSKDVTWVEVEARPPTTTKEEVEDSSNNNQLGWSYVADVQHSGTKAPFHCTDDDDMWTP